MYYADEVVLDKVLARTIVRDLAKIAPNPCKFPAEQGKWPRIQRSVVRPRLVAPLVVGKNGRYGIAEHPPQRTRHTASKQKGALLGPRQD